MFLSVGLRWGLKLYIYNHPHADACTADPRTSMSNNTQGMIFIIILYNFYNLNSFSVQPHLISKPFYWWMRNWCAVMTGLYCLLLCFFMPGYNNWRWSGENIVKSNGLIDCWEPCLSPFSAYCQKGKRS